MYKITHNIIHVNKDKYLRPTRETRRRGTHYFKYYIEFPNIDQYNVMIFISFRISQELSEISINLP